MSKLSRPIQSGTLPFDVYGFTEIQTIYEEELFFTSLLQALQEKELYVDVYLHRRTDTALSIFVDGLHAGTVSLQKRKKYFEYHSLIRHENILHFSGRDNIQRQIPTFVNYIRVKSSD